jgi:uncharacterized protein YdbL (DUF1318 family)
MKTRLSLLVMLLIFVCSIPVSAQKPMEDIRARMKERFKALQDLKLEGKIGETQLGWVESVHEENAKDPAIKKIVEDENADRKELYAIIAKRTETSPKAVGEQNALRIFKKATPDELFKGPDGKWRTKKTISQKKPPAKQ